MSHQLKHGLVYALQIYAHSSGSVKSEPAQLKCHPSQEAYSQLYLSAAEPQTVSVSKAERGWEGFLGRDTSMCKGLKTSLSFCEIQFKKGIHLPDQALKQYKDIQDTATYCLFI